MVINSISKQIGIPTEAMPTKQNTDRSAVPVSSKLDSNGTAASSLETQNTPTVEFERLQKAVQTAIDKLVDTVEASQTNVTFSVHEETRTVIIKVEDANTGKTIREFPPEEVLDSAAHILQMMGLFVDQSA